MKKSYEISGMTCGGCVSNVKNRLKSIQGVLSVEVRLDVPQATIKSDHQISVEELQKVLKSIGKYEITEYSPRDTKQLETGLPEKSVETYKPLILIVIFILGVSLLVQFPFVEFSYSIWMRYFMAGFFVVFSFFKMLNLKGFADAFKMYDIIAGKWKVWGYVYPFVELVLGILYLLDINPVLTNLTTVIVLGVSSVGVIKSNLSKKEIKCACLGDVFNLPMSTVTIVEDMSMVFMAILMLGGM
ncbi:MAG: cation transporter [Bacteroidia bacterium]|nr:cation transporter [Bacteroidia bacterium]